MQITTSKGDSFEAMLLTDATWDHSLIIGFTSEIEKLSEIADKFEGLTYIDTDQGARYPVDTLTSVTLVSPSMYQVRITKGV